MCPLLRLTSLRSTTIHCHKSSLPAIHAYRMHCILNTRIFAQYNLKHQVLLIFPLMKGWSINNDSVLKDLNCNIDFKEIGTMVTCTHF